MFPWQYGVREIDSVVLPTGRLHFSNGSFQSTPAARAYLTYPSALGSPRPLALAAEFGGHFVGTGGDAGTASIGTWQLQSGSDIVLTGAFGAEYESRVSTILPPPSEDRGVVGRTSLIARPDGSGNIEIAARDADGDRIELSASELFEAGEVVIAGDRLLAAASSAIDRQLQVLNVYMDIGEISAAPFALRCGTRRTKRWRATSSAPQSPIRSGAAIPPEGRREASDERAVETLQDALDALSSPIEIRGFPRRGRGFRRSSRKCGRVGRLRLQCHIRGVGITMWKFSSAIRISGDSEPGPRQRATTH